MPSVFPAPIVAAILSIGSIAPALAQQPTIKVDEPPACPATTQLLAVASRTDHGIRLVDPSRGEVTARIATGRGPHELTASPDGGRLYVANMGVYPVSTDGALRFVRDTDNTVSVVDPAAGEVLAQHKLTGFARPHGIAVSGDGRRLWVSAEEQSSVLEVETETGRIVERWRTPQPAHMVLGSADGTKLYAATTAGAIVSVIDRATNSVRPLEVGTGPEGMALRPQSRELWVASRIANTLSVIDTRSDTVVATVPTGGEFSLKLAFSPDGRSVWVSNNASGTVTLLDAATRRLVDSVDLGTATLGIAVSADGRHVAVALPRRGEVALIDAKARTVLCTIPVGRDADGVAWYARPATGTAGDGRATVYLEAAQAVGMWLRSLQDDDGAIPDDALRPGSTASLGEGAAGRALFLHELDRATGNPNLVANTTAAADRLLALLPDAMAGDGFPPRTSLYYGAPGIGLVLLRLHETTGQPRHLEGARDVADWLVSGKGAEGSWSSFNDILFGDAGTIVFLLEASEALDSDATLRRAAEAGRALVARARSEHGGLYWVLREGGTSNLPNFSHGAAGVGYLMTRLYEATGDDDFLDAALGAATYLEAIADTTGGALRVPYGLDRPEWRERYELGWGHGIAGTARFFGSLARVRNDAQWWSRVRAADQAVHSGALAGDPDVERRFGLAGLVAFELWTTSQACRGQGFTSPGNAHADLAREIADAVLARGVREGERLYWRAPRPSFMTGAGEPGALTGWLHGAAGVGMMLVRLDAAVRRHECEYPDVPW